MKLDFAEVDEYSSLSESRTVITTWFGEVVLIRVLNVQLLRDQASDSDASRGEGIVGRYTTFVYGKMIPGADFWTREGLRRRGTS